MDKKEEREIHINSNMHVEINNNLMIIAFTIFTFLIAINKEILKNDTLLALQLVSAIPLLMTASLIRIKITNSRKYKALEELGRIFFIVAYAFVINTVGILLSTFVSNPISMIFFGINIFAALLYSIIIISQEKGQFKKRLYKDTFFIITIVCLGLLPSLGVY